MPAARWSLVGLFVVNGFTAAAWLSRIPAIREALDVTPGQLGLLLLAGSMAGVPTMVTAPRIVAAVGQAHAVRLAGALFGVGYLVMGLACAAGSAPLLAGGLVLHGTAWALNGFTTDFASTIVERRLQRPVIAHFHAGFGIGMVLGSLAAAAAAALGIPLVAWFSGLAVLAVVWRLVAARWMLPHDAPAPRPARFWRRRRPAQDVAGTEGGYALADAWRDPRALVIGVIALATICSELAAADWVALALVDGRGVAGSVAALGFTTLMLAATVVRLASARLILRLGRVRTVRFGALLAISGVLLFVFAPTLPLAAVGVAAWGAGHALNIPIAVSAASDDPSRTANRIVVMSVFALAPLLFVPVGIGALSDAVGVRYALVAVAVVLTAIVAVAGRIAPESVTSPTEPDGAPGRLGAKR